MFPACTCSSELKRLCLTAVCLADMCCTANTHTKENLYVYTAASKTNCLPVCGPVSPCDLGWVHFTCWRTWGVFDLCLCPSLLPVFEPELEFFVFSPGGVASTGLIQNTQTSCSTTPAATVSKPPPRYACLYPSHPAPLLQRRAHVSSSTTISHTCLHGYHLARWCPWLQPSFIRPSPTYH